ncbi:Hypothetical protein PHPALM_17531 [Phytophthora palmivora]|uniref:Uncharacterized protein n=1 Tax=Phytophthora palmivora TaxID=4796 RepID=A0A2P4XM01_9STRA|nr:Hypothetical protein PHPALM_17531 [Phytophthora palmivora]
MVRRRPLSCRLEVPALVWSAVIGPSSPGDTTSDATIKSGSVDAATMDPVSTLVMEQGNRHHNEHIHLARLIAFALTQPPEPSDSIQHQAILHAESASALVDILRGQYQPPNSCAELAQLRVDLHSAEASNVSFQKRLPEAAGLCIGPSRSVEAAARDLRVRMAPLEAATQTAEVTTTRSALHAAEPMIKGQDEDITVLSKSIVERDEAYKILHCVSAKHFQQLQEIVVSLDDDGSHTLRHAKKTIDEMRETIIR